MKSLSSNNPIIYHAPTSLERHDFRTQSLINSLARKLIRKDLKHHANHAHYTITNTSIRIA